MVLGNDRNANACRLPVKDQVSKEVDRWLAETEFTQPPPQNGGARFADRAAFEQGEKK